MLIAYSVMSFGINDTTGCNLSFQKSNSSRFHHQSLSHCLKKREDLICARNTVTFYRTLCTLKSVNVIFVDQAWKKQD